MMDALASLYADTIGVLHTWLFEQVVQPILYHTGLIGYDEIAFGGTEWFILGVLEMAVLYVVLRPLEAWRPVERWPDRRQVGVDVLYTALNRLGIVPLAMLALLTPASDAIMTALRMAGFQPWHLDTVVPVLGEHPLAAFAVYLVVIDFAEYWRHRLSHKFEWWWALHALHHSQRRMSFWTDNRSHLIEDFLQSIWLATLALAIGIPPGQFFLAIIATRMLESLQHANLRLGFGAIGERLLVSPRFHRLHHAIGLGHEGIHRGCNFAVLFPVWDMLFRTASFVDRYEATGIRDQLDGRDYGAGWWRQQVLGVRRMWAALRRTREAVDRSPAGRQTS